MSSLPRRLVLGCSWYENQEKQGRVLVGEPNRETVDRLLGGVPIDIRPHAAKFFAPMVEGGMPDKEGTYLRVEDNFVVVWWKWAQVMPEVAN